jgi:hypothetical protein
MAMQLAIDLIRHPEALALFARASKDDGPGVSSRLLAAKSRPRVLRDAVNRNRLLPISTSLVAEVRQA